MAVFLISARITHEFSYEETVKKEILAPNREEAEKIFKRTILDENEPDNGEAEHDSSSIYNVKSELINGIEEETESDVDRIHSKYLTKEPLVVLP